MLIDFNETPNQVSQPALPAIAPPPPAVKPPTLASVIDGHMKWLVTEVGDLNQDVGMLDTKLSTALARMEQSLRRAEVAIGMIALVLLVVATELGVLIGQGR